MTSKATPPERPLARDTSRMPIRMLIVEDDQDLADIVGRVASIVDEELIVDVAPTAVEAKERLASEQYHFVLLDNYLEHGAQGVDLIDLVRETQPDAGLAMMSSMDLSRLIQLTSHERTMQILPKPFSAQLLKAFLHDVLGPFYDKPLVEAQIA